MKAQEARDLRRNFDLNCILKIIEIGINKSIHNQVSMESFCFGIRYYELEDIKHAIKYFTDEGFNVIFKQCDLYYYLIIDWIE